MVKKPALSIVPFCDAFGFLATTQTAHIRALHCPQAFQKQAVAHSNIFQWIDSPEWKKILLYLTEMSLDSQLLN